MSRCPDQVCGCAAHAAASGRGPLVSRRRWTGKSLMCEVERIWCIEGTYFDGSFKDHVLSTPGWLSIQQSLSLSIHPADGMWYCMVAPGSLGSEGLVHCICCVVYGYAYGLYICVCVCVNACVCDFK